MLVTLRPSIVAGISIAPVAVVGIVGNRHRYVVGIDRISIQAKRAAPALPKSAIDRKMVKMSHYGIYLSTTVFSQALKSSSLD